MIPTTAGAVTETASSGQVSAAFSYEVASKPEFPLGKEISNETLTITRGAQVYSKSICGAFPACLGLSPVASLGAGSPSSIQVVDLESNGEPDVLVQLWAGGAHCCAIFKIFRWDPSTSTYGMTEHTWELAPRITDLAHNGHLEFLAADFRFGYAFTSFGGSGFPIQIFVFKGGIFTDVTHSYPALITADARAQFSRYRSNYSAPQGGLGFLAAWVADEYLLGHRTAALSLLRRENRRGKLHAPNGNPQGGAYITKLVRFLSKLGYTGNGPTVTRPGMVAPVFGHTANLKPVSGTVLVETPGTTSFVPLGALASVPLGTVIDTSNGTVQLISATATHRHTQTGRFYSGIFRVTQTTGASPLRGGRSVGITVLSLAGGLPTGCAAVHAGKAAAATTRTARRLWGNAHGNFRTAGRYASATVRGTEWLTEDTCAGTLVKVVRGLVSVENLRTHRAVLVRAGRSFLSR